MKRIVTILVFVVVSLGASAQSLRIGGKSPSPDALVWLTELPAEKKRTTLVEFFHSSNEICTSRIEELGRIATEHADSLNVIVVVRGDDSLGHQMLTEQNLGFCVVQLTPRALRSLGVRYVPYAYVTSPKRRTLWCGNPVFLQYQTLKQLISDGKYYDKPLRKATSRRTRR
ncbi:MAG: hypothetical protein J6R31_03365 [Rikenellaceae bacterium]|jgi:hypothetical protein|nr:hypothetical protein [Rikenellaceae bacterium]MBO5759063.1 hypothetical protein [Rikenellaceae bacterium]